MMGLIIPGSNVASGGGADCCCFRQHPSGVVAHARGQAKPNKKSKKFPTDGGGSGRRMFRAGEDMYEVV